MSNFYLNIFYFQFWCWTLFKFAVLFRFLHCCIYCKSEQNWNIVLKYLHCGDWSIFIKIYYISNKVWTSTSLYLIGTKYTQLGQSAPDIYIYKLTLINIHPWVYLGSFYKLTLINIYPRVYLGSFYKLTLINIHPRIYLGSFYKLMKYNLRKEQYTNL